MARKPRRPKLVQPAHLWVPDHVSSAAAEAADLAESAGLVLDPEQRLTLEAVLAEREGRRWAAIEAAIIEARQNGKTVDLQAIVLADLYLFDAELVVWSAHLFDTTQEAFRDLKLLIEGTPHLSRRVKRIYEAHGKEAIELHSGQRLKFKARTKTGGRGLTGDRVILDEAFALSPSEMGSLFPLLTARPNPSVVYASSAGLVDSAILRRIRDRGRAGGDPSLTYIEWCAPPGGCKVEDCDHHVGAEGCALDDPDNWQAANPATVRGRITLDYIEAERRALPPDEFQRERLGWWDEPAGGVDGLPIDDWVACGDADAELVDPVTFALDVAPGHSSASIAACGGPIELVVNAAGSAWVIDRLQQLAAGQNPSAVGLDPSGPAGSLVPYLEAAGFSVRTPTNPDGLLVLLDGRGLISACGAFLAETTERNLVHRDQPLLNAAVAGAARKQVGDAWKWSRRDSTVDISPLVASTIARFLWVRPEIEGKSGFFMVIGADS